MKAKAHATAGMVAGGAIAAIPYVASSIPIPPGNESVVAPIAVGCALGALAAAIPDTLESSKRLGPNHRACSIAGLCLRRSLESDTSSTEAGSFSILL